MKRSRSFLYTPGDSSQLVCGDGKTAVARIRNHLPGEKASPGVRSEAEITEVLRQWRHGDASAFDRLTERLYDQLRLVADQALGKDWGNKSLQPTELVHEAYLRAERLRTVFLILPWTMLKANQSATTAATGSLS